MTINFCRECLQEAIDTYGSPRIFNTDQGSQFTSPYFISLWKENIKHEVKISMDGRGRATDNAFIERLWCSMKQENIYRNDYEDGGTLFLVLNDYFYFYNNERKHQGIKDQIPEKKHIESCKDIEMLKVQTKSEASHDFQHFNIIYSNDDFIKENET